MLRKVRVVEVRNADPFARIRAEAERRLQKLRSDVFPEESLPSPEEELEARRLELRNGLTDMERLFLFGKLSGLNDKDAALAAGYSLSVSENTRQKIWKPQVIDEFARVKLKLLNPSRVRH